LHLNQFLGNFFRPFFRQQNVDFLYLHKVNEKEFSFDTREIKKILGDVSLKEPEVYMWLSGYLKEGEAELTN
jgi:hypothetical protein